jgi:DNA-binding MarR family transcriptional regulator
MINPTKEQMVVLGAAAVNGEYAVSRAYNSKWGDDLQVLKDLESMGLMELVTLERNPLTNAFVRTARITPAGRAAWEAFIRTTKD